MHFDAWYADVLDFTNVIFQVLPSLFLRYYVYIFKLIVKQSVPLIYPVATFSKAESVTMTRQLQESTEEPAKKRMHEDCCDMKA